MAGYVVGKCGSLIWKESTDPQCGLFMYHRSVLCLIKVCYISEIN